MTAPQTPTGQLLDKWIKEAIVTTTQARRARRKQVRSIEVEAAAMARERLRKEWDRLMAASDWPFDAATFTVEFYKLLADPTP